MRVRQALALKEVGQVRGEAGPRTDAMRQVTVRQAGMR